MHPHPQLLGVFTIRLLKCNLYSRVLLQCTYTVAGLHALFSAYKFESDTVGVGRIVHSNRIIEGGWFNN